MSATDKLRHMLDERGVKWWPMHDVENGYYQDRDTEFVINGKKYIAHEWGVTLNVYGLTPEQAIEATLGRGTCRNASDFPSYTFVCSECGSKLDLVDEFDNPTMQHDDGSIGPLFCPECGRVVVVS